MCFSDFTVWLFANGLCCWLYSVYIWFLLIVDVYGVVLAEIVGFVAELAQIVV